MKRLGVVGWPVAHSRSPAMQNAALAALGLSDWHYQRLPMPPEVFAETVAALPEMGFVGVNVTIPHKEAALAIATSAGGAARAIGAANTLTFGDGGEIHAENTDAPGFLAALDRPVDGLTALVLGAGGSGRAVAWALAQAGAEVRIWNRSADRAAALAADLGVTHDVAGLSADLIVNCTSIGLAGEGVDALPITSDHFAEARLVADLVYRAGGTALLAEAVQAGCQTVDGLEVLVRQGALSLTEWTGQTAPLDVMRAAAAD